ncbi:MAG: HAD-IC family P-type ATPase [Clostridia bacterium]|nr:HAD-IC family P-type ATPase [Clostridia bacterium]
MLQIMSSIPGRARFKAGPLYCNQKLSSYLRAYMDHLFGVKCSSTNPYTATVLVEFDEKKISIHTLQKNILHVISTVPAEPHSDLGKYEEYNSILAKRDKAKRNFILFGLLYIGYKIKSSLYGKFALSSNVRVLQAASLVTVIGGYPVIKRLYKLLTRHLPADFDSLLKLAAISFTLVRESSKGLLVLVLKELNDYIKLSADAENWRLLNQTLEKNTGMAWLVTSQNQETLVAVSTLKPGDRISVHKGELIPANGEVLEGEGVSNSLYFTGQPVIDCLVKGSKVYEGISLIAGEIQINVTDIPAASYKEDISLDKLYLQKRVSIYQQNISKVSLSAATISYLFSNSTLKALSTLLVMSPSAAGTALSSGIKSYVSLLNKHGIYLRNPNTFENITRVNHVLFDKTGTLTYGRMQIWDIVNFSGAYSDSELLKICAACEANNYHPISITLKAEAGGRYDIKKVDSSVYIPSKGVMADYEGHEVMIGSKHLMEEHNIDISKGLNQYQRFDEQLCTPVFVSIDRKLSGIIAMRDHLREGSYELIKGLKSIGIHRISLVTGDTSSRAEYIASKLGIDEVYSSCSLDDKVGVVNEAKRHGKVMMVGDGVNDIRAMIAADISVSFVNSSCDKAKLHSDCILLEDRMLKLADLFSLSRKSFSKINQSITISQLFNGTLGVAGSLIEIDPFAAKSLNTSNSLLALLLNKRVEYLNPAKPLVTKI